MSYFVNPKITPTIKVCGTILFATMPIWIWFYTPIVIVLILIEEWLPPKNWKNRIQDMCLGILNFREKLKGKRYD